MTRLPQNFCTGVGVLLISLPWLTPVAVGQHAGGQHSGEPVRYAYDGRVADADPNAVGCNCAECSGTHFGGSGVNGDVVYGVTPYAATPILDRVFRGGRHVVGITREYIMLAFRNTAMDGRYTGLGDPLVASSWLNRPYHVGWRTGGLFGDAVQAGQVTQDPTLMFGLQVGADLDHYLGTEWRLSWASPKLNNVSRTQYERTGELFWTDINAMYYPWGDSRLRPFASVGIGLSEFDFRDQTGVREKDRLFTLPLGVGIKHYWRRWLSWRVDVYDNLALTGGTVDTMHNITATFGVEMHFGVRPRSYWPWFPDRHHR